MKYPTSKFNWKGEVKNITWIKSDSLENFTPLKQVHGICFSSKKEILICRASKNDDWHLPGGKPELGETIEQSLRREFLEEVGAEIKNIRVLGVQKVESPTIYQARCVCELVKLLPQTPDPATGKIHQRKFVSISKIEQYIKWGKIGKVLFKEAFELWQKE